jgi:hypothetical protein
MDGKPPGVNKVFEGGNFIIYVIDKDNNIRN